MIGGSFVAHPWNSGDPAVTIDVEDPSHPSALHLDTQWVIQDEIYMYRKPTGTSELEVRFLWQCQAARLGLFTEELYGGTEYAAFVNADEGHSLAYELHDE